MLETLYLGNLKIPSISVRQLCLTMKNMTSLNLSGVLKDPSSDEVILAIAISMPHLQTLDLLDCNVSISALECLLPSKDNPLRGCPKLTGLGLWRISDITVEFLKKIIFSLPKLQLLLHELTLDVLVEVTDVELGVESGRCLKQFHVDLTSRVKQPTHYNILQNAPIFAFDCSITHADVRVQNNSKIPIKDFILPLKKLKSIIIHGMSKSSEGFVSVLESKGICLETLHLIQISKTVSLDDIIETCPNLKELILKYLSSKINSDFKADHERQQDQQTDQSVLPCLKTITLENVSDDMCSSETLISLLLCRNLEKINFTSVQTMSDDVMFKVLSSSRTSLSKVKSFTLHSCPAITAASFVQWFSSEKIVLEDLHITDCDMDDQDVLHAAAEKYPRQLNVKVRPVSLIEFPRYLGKAQGPCLENCHCCAYRRRMCRK